MTSSPSGQSRTPPHLKWLLNERAMLRGEVARRDEAIQRLRDERELLCERIRALDSTMGMFAPQLDPEAGGTVRAIAGRYGPRGGLSAFVLNQVLAAGPVGIDSKTIRERAGVHFKVPFDTASQQQRFKDTVGWTLRDLFQRKLVEVASDSRGGHRPKVWRGASGVAFADLLADKDGDHAQDPDSL